MTNTKEYVFPKRKDTVIVFEDSNNQIVFKNIPTNKQKKEIFLAFQNAIKTRIRKDNKSIYVNTPSREIKKWFETRRI